MGLTMLCVPSFELCELITVECLAHVGHHYHDCHYQHHYHNTWSHEEHTTIVRVEVPGLREAEEEPPMGETPGG